MPREPLRRADRPDETAGGGRPDETAGDDRPGGTAGGGRAGGGVRRAAAIVAGLLAAQVLLVALFVLPGHKPEPHGLPVGVAGPAAAAAAIEHALADRGDDFEIHRYSTEEQARAAIDDREIYGAFLPPERRLLVASAAGPVVAQLLSTGAGEAGQRVEDVRPTAEGDPRGAAINLAFLPLIVICLPLVALLGRLGLRRRELLGLLAAFAAAGGLLIAALVGALDAVPGPYLAVAGVTALIILAVALPAAGLMRLIGPAGIGIAALLFLVIGNPGSGNASAPELLPGFWRVTGQLLPPGAGGQALRSATYFDGHALAAPLLVLGAWAAAGAVFVLLARSRVAEQAEAPRPIATAA